MTEKQIAVLEKLGFKRQTDRHYHKRKPYQIWDLYETHQHDFTLTSGSPVPLTKFSRFDRAIEVYLEHSGEEYTNFDMDGEKYKITKLCKNDEIRYLVERIIKFEADEELQRLIDGYEKKTVPLGIVQDKLRDLQ